MSTYTADQLATIIKIACKKDVIDLGEESDQNFYIYEWINMYLHQYAKKIRKTRTSDALSISSTGYVSFLYDSVVISDMYEPYQILDANDRAFRMRTSFDDTGTGWYREDAFADIHVRGANGTYRLKYIKFPEKITLGSQTPECSPASYGELISWVCSRIKYTKGYYEESNAMLADANAVRLGAVKAAQSGMGTNAQKPGPDDANLG
jgi:hypothetical protein